MQSRKNTLYKKSLSNTKIPHEPTINIFPITQQHHLGKHVDKMEQSNVLRRSSLYDAEPFLFELGIEIEENKQPIQFTTNFEEPIHRWSPYIQGFSSSFVQSIINKYKKEYELGKSESLILDPFAGAGTVLIQSKINGIPSIGIELNPLLSYISKVKAQSWGLLGRNLIEVFESLPKQFTSEAPSFLESERQFNPGVLKNLQRLKGGIEHVEKLAHIFVNGNRDGSSVGLIDLLKVAFCAILTDCSNLKRTPCLGYDSNKQVSDDQPFLLMNAKVNQIAEDLDFVQKHHRKHIETPVEVVLANSMTYDHNYKYDLVITSPPYMNGLDYVINYKIEMAWLNFTKSHSEAKKIKDSMVVCDNVSKGLIRKFANDNDKYSNEWLDLIVNKIQKNIDRRGVYRRLDMPFIVHKYFDDMYRVFKKVIPRIKHGGRFILVVGDSLIADVYLPTDLLLAKMGQELGMKIEKIELARLRRSGQVRSYKLRETIISLKK